MSFVADRRTRALGLIAVAVALLLALAGVPATSAQGTTINALYSSDAVPADDPFSPRWDLVRAVAVPLSGQVTTQPMLPVANVTGVDVRAMTDGDRLAIMLEWQDTTRNESVLTADAFADQAAVQFGLGEGASICMGAQAGALNIWHWKADWAADLASMREIEAAHPNMPRDEHWPAQSPGASPDPLGPHGFLSGQMAGNLRSLPRTSSVEDLTAVGFGSLTAQPADRQEVQGASAHGDGRWRVVFSRKLADPDPNDAPLATARTFVVAFAVWDGARGDRNGQKSVSNWVALGIPQRPLGLLDGWPFLVMIVLALSLAGWMLWLGARQPAVGLSGPK